MTQAYEARCTGFPLFVEQQIAFGVTEFNCIQIRKAPIQGTPSVKYLKDGSLVDWPPSEFEFLLETQSTYGAIVAKSEWPVTDQHPRPVNITFEAGFGDTFIDVPIPIRTGLLQHVAFMYENRGDCGCAQSAGAGFTMKSLPATSRLIYSRYVIYSISNEWRC